MRFILTYLMLALTLSAQTIHKFPGVDISRAADPPAPADGTFWYNTVLDQMKARVNGVSVEVGNGGESVVPMDSNLITEGDSRTGIGGGGLGVGDEWPLKLASMPAFAGRVTLLNPAIGGSNIAIMAARYAGSIFPLRPAATGKPAILIIFCGGNDIATGTSASSTVTALGTYCTTARADGFTVWLCTDIGRTNFTSAQWVQYHEFNRLLRVQTWWDRLVDLGSAFQDPGDVSLFPDGLHENAAGALAIARYINWHAYHKTQPLLTQQSGVVAGRIQSSTAYVYDTAVIEGVSGGHPLVVTGATVSGGSIFVQPGASDDYAGMSFNNRSSGASAQSRKFLVRTNHADTMGQMVFIQSGASTWDVLNVRLSIAQDGGIDIGKQLRMAVSTPATLGAGATTLAITTNVAIVTGDGGGNTLSTITGGVSGATLTLIFTDANVTITDTDAATANTVNLSAAWTSSANDTLSLVYASGKWFETGRSVN